MATITCIIGGVDRTEWIGAATVRIEGAINGRYSCTGNIRSRRTGYRPQRGNTFVIYEGATKRFAGNIFSITERDAGGSRGIMEYDFRCVDYNHIFNRRLFTGEFENQSLSAIVAGIVGSLNEGITIASIPAPPTITQKLTFKLETVASIFNKLTALTGYLWSINFDKVLTVSPFTAASAPMSVTDANDTWPTGWRGLTIERSDENKRNRQWEVTEAQLQMTYTDTFTVIQNGQDFIPTSAPILSMTGITVNGVSKTTAEDTNPGNGAVPSTADLYWTTNWIGVWTEGWETGIPSAGLTLNAGDVVVISYRGAARNMVMVEDNVDQYLRASIEGGSGIWEAREDHHYQTDYNALVSLGNGRLAQNGVDSIRAQFETDCSGMAPGQRVTVTVPRWDVDQELLTERVTSLWVRVGPGDEFFRHQVTAVGVDLAALSPVTSPTSATYIEPVTVPENYMERVVEMARVGDTPAQLVEEAQASESSSGPMLTLYFQDAALTVGLVSLHYPELAIGADRLWHPTLWHANLKTPAVGGSPTTECVEWIVEYSTNDGATWSELFTDHLDDSERADDGDFATDYSPAIDLNLSDGTLFRARILQVGSSTPGGGLTVQIEGDLV
jgi:hypothetical protein